MKKTITIFALTISTALSAQERSLVIQEQNYMKEQNKLAGEYLQAAKQSKIESILYMTTFSALGSTIFAFSEGKTGAMVLGSCVFAFGASMSIYKNIDAFDKIKEAGLVFNR